MREVENPMVIDSLWKTRTISDDYFADLFDDGEFDEEVYCKECGEVMFLEDIPHQSEIWEDTFLCESRECHKVHYTGWAESMALQKYYRKVKKPLTGIKDFFVGK